MQYRYVLELTEELSGQNFRACIWWAVAFIMKYYASGLRMR